jgi:hypothetical protein
MRKPAAHVIGHEVELHVPDRFGSHTYWQATQGTLPVTVLIKPAWHAVQVPPLGPVKPALHRHWVIAEAPVVVVDELLGHAVHEALPLLAAYVPTAHGEHCSAPAAANVPGPQSTYGPAGLGPA